MTAAQCSNFVQMHLLLNCTVAALLLGSSGCVPKLQFVALQNELDAARARAETQRQHSQQQLDSCRTTATVMGDSLAALTFRLNDLETGMRERMHETENLRQDLDRFRTASGSELRQAVMKLEETRQDLHLRELRLAQLAPFSAQGLLVQPEPTETVGQVRVLLADKLLFKLGSYLLDTTGRRALLQVATVLRDNPTLTVAVEGHTDSLPVRNLPGLRDNWDLSTRRALEVVRFLQTEGRIAPGRCSAVGSGEWRPVATNTTPEGQARNRRTEIIVRLPASNPQP
jgi:chemotaxis protein MotB